MGQLKLNIYRGKQGGRRPGAGRKRQHSKGVAHREREDVHARVPLHINFKYKCSIRNKETLRLLKKAILNARRKGLRILQYSFQSNHVHLIVEADSNQILSSGMRSLTVTMARGLHRGKIQLERYHLHVLRSLREAKNALHYVLFNEQKHERGTSVVTPYSSLLSLKRGLELIKKYAIREKVAVRVERGDDWSGDHPSSFLYKKALTAL